MREKAMLFGVGYHKVTLGEATEDALALAKEKRGAYTVTPNPEILWQALNDPDLLDILKKADQVLPDGIGVLMAARILGDPIPHKVAGVELGEEIIKASGSHGLTVGFLGAKPGVAEKAAENMKKKYPDLLVAGCFDGYFKDAEKAAQKVKESGADILFVCLGSPKQEKFIRDYALKTGAGLLLGLGGSLDIYAGTAVRAPRWMIRTGLEWLYRLFKEPKRLGRMMKIPLFLLYTLKMRILHTKA